MSDESASEIEKILSDLPTDDSKEVTENIDEKRKQVMIKALQQSAEKLGKSPTVREFNDLETSRSSTVIKQAFGTWNNAKKAAGLETRQRGTLRKIDEEYFAEIDTSEKAYWFGTLIATSSLQSQEGSYDDVLRLGRVEGKEYFITELANAVGSNHQISRYTDNNSGEERVHFQISNPTFIDNLLDAGYPDQNEELESFPDIAEALIPSFLRGFLESSGYFTSGWHINARSESRAYTLQSWFEEFGAKRANVSENADTGITVNVSNAFDIKTVIEVIWPNGIDTEPSFTPYLKKIIEHLQEEYPYPENVEYLED